MMSGGGTVGRTFFLPKLWTAGTGARTFSFFSFLVLALASAMICSVLVLGRRAGRGSASKGKRGQHLCTLLEYMKPPMHTLRRVLTTTMRRRGGPGLD